MSGPRLPLLLHREVEVLFLLDVGQLSHQQGEVVGCARTINMRWAADSHLNYFNFNSSHYHKTAFVIPLATYSGFHRLSPDHALSALLNRFNIYKIALVMIFFLHVQSHLHRVFINFAAPLRSLILSKSLFFSAYASS